MKRIARLLLLLVCCLSPLAPLRAQQGVPTYVAYIKQYHRMAQEQMLRHRIPASITLAQGLLESGAGQSDLARRANNHFGIKVAGGWTGPYVVKSDDRPDDKFRKYNSVEES
ncbi:MAG: glucosaminidase domain-containing protein, partial [Bacteroidaceae bacterium]|nr:glucosaminidase domain-containing protein [Bacteroidaceae bacterium]